MRIRSILGAAAAAGLIMGLALPAFAQGEKKQVDQGKQLFDAQKCSICHSVNGKGNPKGPLDDVGSKLSEDQLRSWLTEPSQMATKMNATRKPAMPSYASKLSKDQVDALADYLETLKKK